jgi:curved DNA-binding protein
MDYYSTLGVTENAGQDEIKQAYKKLAMKHHPDRGGDTQLFQSISQAYDTLSDPDKRSQYDAERQGFGGTQFHFHAGRGNPFDPLNQMFGGANPFEQFFNQQAYRHRVKNRDLNIRCTVSFKQAFTGSELEASYTLPSGKNQTVVIKVPPGIDSGQVIRYGGMGDDSIPNAPRGDLNVTIMVQSDPDFSRRGDDLIAFLTINPIEAMLGCSKIVTSLDDNGIRINLEPGVQPGSEFLSKGLGFRNINSGYRGNLIIHIKVNIPAITDTMLKSQLENIHAELNNLSKPNTK